MIAVIGGLPGKGKRAWNLSQVPEFILPAKAAMSRLEIPASMLGGNFDTFTRMSSPGDKSR